MSIRSLWNTHNIKTGSCYVDNILVCSQSAPVTTLRCVSLLHQNQRSWLVAPPSSPLTNLHHCCDCLTHAVNLIVTWVSESRQWTETGHFASSPDLILTAACVQMMYECWLKTVCSHDCDYVCFVVQYQSLIWISRLKAIALNVWMKLSTL